MPIKDKSLYPANWKQISLDARARAGNVCEVCNVKNGAYIYRHAEDKARYIYYDRATDNFTEPDGAYLGQGDIPDAFNVSEQPVKVVLTCAHLDNDPRNNTPSNLRVLCQYHHLTLDAKYHAQNAKKTRAAKRATTLQTSGQLALFEDDQS